MAGKSIGSTFAFLALVLAYSFSAALYLDFLAASTGIKDGPDSYGLAELEQFDQASTYLFFGGVIFAVLLFEAFRRLRLGVPNGALLVALPLAMIPVVYMVWHSFPIFGGF